MTATLTTQPDRQVWPSLRPAPKPAPVPREDRKPVTLADVRVGDTLSFLTEGRDYRVVARDGEVIRCDDRCADVQIPGVGRVVLTRKNWERRAPRR